MGNIKNKIVFIFIFAAISVAGIAALIFVMQKGTKSLPNVRQVTGLVDQFQLKNGPEKLTVQPEEKTLQSTILDTSYFSLNLPFGWERESLATDTLPIAIIDSQEKLTNDKAKEIDFRTNISINSTGLGSILLKDYVESVKTNLINAIPILEIMKEEQTNISGKDAYFLEIESVQKDLIFSTIVVFTIGKENTVWAFSFNTLKESRLNYKDVFDSIIKSIKMKQDAQE
ncbi:MAG: hypothetical protein HYT20_00745 [Candidatus Nealsonbacteria bacterium]|nr:hypothetical protein [Candidatus Nealsonbacteria bacterium]